MVTTVNVSSGQTLSGGTVSGIFLVVQSGGSIVGETVINGTAFVQSGGTATGTIVSGQLTVSAGGVATGTTIASGGSEQVFGVDSGGTVSGGSLTVSAGGTAIATTIQSTATTVATPGGTFVNPVVGSGAALFANPSQVMGGVTLAVGASLISNLPFVAGGTATLNSATDVLTLTERDTMSSIQLAGSYAGDTFQLASLFGIATIITVARGNIVIPTGSGTLAVATSAPLQTAFAMAIGAQAASAQIVSGTGFAPQSVTVANAVVIDLPNGSDTITGAAAVPRDQVLLANAGAVYATGGTAISTVVVADATPATVINNNPNGALLALTGAANAGGTGDTLEGLAGANQFVTGAGGSNAVLLDGVANSLTTSGTDAVLAGGPSTVTAAGGGSDAITLSPGTTLAFVNGSTAPGGSFVHSADGGIVLLAGPGTTQIVPRTGTEYDFIDTSAGNVTISAGPGFNAFTFIKNADAGTANVFVNLPPPPNVSLGDVVAIHGYASSSIGAGRTARRCSRSATARGSRSTTRPWPRCSRCSARCSPGVYTAAVGCPDCLRACHSATKSIGCSSTGGKPPSRVTSARMLRA